MADHSPLIRERLKSIFAIAGIAKGVAEATSSIARINISGTSSDGGYANDDWKCTQRRKAHKRDTRFPNRRRPRPFPGGMSETPPGIPSSL
jgi:hypothetical protein